MYDLIVIGTGPAGLTASIYACCFKLNHLTIGALPGGQMTLAPDILNYPGFEEISGPQLTNNMINQVKKRGGDIIVDSVKEIKKTKSSFILTTVAGNTYETKSIILATGVERRKLRVPGETEYTGKGIQYCATCERFEYEGKVCAVVGGANAAAQSAMQLSHAASKVYILYRGEKLRCEPIWLSQIQASQNIKIVPYSKITEIVGDGNKLTHVKLESAQKTEKNPDVLAVDRLFIEIGGVPGTALLIPLGAKMDQGGYIDVDDTLQTSIPGIYACGDAISHKYSIEQISSSVGTGARAAMSIFAFINQQKTPNLWGSQQIKS